MRLLPYFQLFHAEMTVCWPGSDLAGIAAAVCLRLDFAKTIPYGEFRVWDESPSASP